MSKYEAWVTVWSEDNKSQIKIVAGTFDRLINAKVFAKAYAEHFRTMVEIVERAKE